MRAKTIDGLTEKERKLVAAKLKGLNNHHAALEAGYDPKSARVQAVEIMRRPQVQAAIREGTESMADILTRCGITVETVLTPVLQALQATVKVNIGTKGKPEYIEQPDLNMRLKGAAMAWKMLADIKPRDSAPVDLTSQLTNQNLSNLDEVELARVVFRNSTN